MRLALWLTLACLLFAPRSFAADIERYTLPNGLKVQLQPDPSVPRVGMCIAYDVGSGHDPEGYAGLGHLVEHLMYRGSANVDMSVLNWYERLGATDYNGITKRDLTTYYVELPSHNWPVGLWLDSDRMAFMLARVSEEMIDREREIVRNEWSQRGGNNTMTKRLQTAMQLMYPVGHPYHDAGEDLSGVGLLSDPDLDAIGLSEVQWYHQRFYRPSRASLALVGDFDVAEAKQLVQRYFGSIRAVGPDPPRIRPPEVTLAEELRYTSRGFGNGDAVVVAWPTPVYGAPLDAALDVVSLALDERLRRALIDSGHALELEVRQMSGALGSVFFIDAKARDDVPADTLLRIIDGELERLRRGGVTQEEHARARRLLLLDVLAVGESPVFRARHLAEWSTPFEEQQARYESLSAAQVARSLELLGPNRVRLYVRTAPSLRGSRLERDP